MRMSPLLKSTDCAAKYLTLLVLIASLFVAADLLLPAQACAADWPQWRGPGRDGMAPESPPLATRWGPSGPKRVWQSEFPASEATNANFSSPVVAEGRVHLCLTLTVYDPDAPCHIKKSKQGGYDPSIPDTLKEKIETARTSTKRRRMEDDVIDARLNNTKQVNPLKAKIKDWAQDWIAANLSEQEQAKFGDYAKERLVRGRWAPSIKLIEKLASIVEKPFANRHALETWFQEQGITGAELVGARRAVTGDKKVSKDTILAFDADTGAKLWRADFPGTIEHWGLSGTPCVKNGRLYWVGSGGVYCLDVGTGQSVWHTPGREFRTNCSPAVEEGMVVFAAGGIRALDAATGEKRWSVPKEPKQEKSFCWTSNGSAAIRRVDGEARAVFSHGGKLMSLDIKTGHLHWQTSTSALMITPILRGDSLVIQGNFNRRGNGLTAFRLKPDGLEKQAETSGVVGSARGASPLLLPDGRALAFGKRGVICLNPAEGKTVFETTDYRGNMYNSPVYADGKVLMVVSKKLFLLQVEGNELRQLGSAALDLSNFASPAFVGGMLYTRGKGEHGQEVISCYDLRAPTMAASHPVNRSDKSE